MIERIQETRQLTRSGTGRLRAAAGCEHIRANPSRRIGTKTNLFYTVKPLLPRSFQLSLRREVVSRMRLRNVDTWPVDQSAAEAPSWWRGWPEGKRFALVLTHDVEHFTGQFFCSWLVAMEHEFGFRSSFNFVPRRYEVIPRLRRYLVSQGCEVGLHDYNHDGKLFRSERIFDKRSRVINQFLAAWQAHGFRSGAMHHNLEWIARLNIEYDCSTFDTDPFEPQPDGVRTVFPFRVVSSSTGREYIEIPYTLPQDFTLFVLMREKGPRIWKEKLDWIAQKGGMALINVHPDYMAFGGTTPGLEKYPARYYREFLRYVSTRYHGEYWHALPHQMARYWRTLPREANQIVVD